MKTFIFFLDKTVYARSGLGCRIVTKRIEVEAIDLVAAYKQVTQTYSNLAISMFWPKTKSIWAR